MTSPVTTAPAARPAAAGAPAGGADSAEPFATALDGAMSAGRREVDGAGPDGRQQEPEQDGSPEGTAAEAVVVPPGTDAAGGAPGLVAVLWARLTGAVGGTGTGAPDEAVPGTPGAPTTTGRAHALEVAGGRAHGLRGLPLGQTPAGGAGPAPAGPVPGTPVPASPVPAVRGAPAPAVPTGTGPVLPPPAPAVAEAAAALAAAGVQVVASTPADAAAPAAVPVPLPAALGGAPAPGSPAAPAAADAEGAALPASSTGTVLTAAAPVAGAPAGGDGGTGRSPSDQASSETAPVSSTTAGPAPSAVAQAARVEQATAAAAAQPVAGQLARPVALLRGGPDGTHSMTVVLTPENLGPVEVTVTLSQGTVDLTLRGAHEHGRAALIDALPDLRRDLEAAGLTCSRVDVDRGARDGREAWSGSQSSQTGGRDGGRGAQQDRGENGARPWHRPADREEGHPARSRTVSGLDVRV